MTDKNPSYYGVWKSPSIQSREDFGLFELFLSQGSNGEYQGLYKDSLGRRLIIPSLRIDSLGVRFIGKSPNGTFNFSGVPNYDSASEQFYRGFWTKGNDKDVERGEFVMSDFSRSPDLAEYLLGCERDLLEGTPARV